MGKINMLCTAAAPKPLMISLGGWRVWPDTECQTWRLDLYKYLCPRYLNNHSKYHLLGPHFSFHFLKKKKTPRRLGKWRELINSRERLQISRPLVVQTPSVDEALGAPQGVISPSDSVHLSH